MYLVPMEIPKNCNECPFGHCNYVFALTGRSISMTDRQENKTGTYGYTCTIDFHKNVEYTKVLRANIGENIQKPGWCALKEDNGNAGTANQKKMV